ncbi:MAG: hypothetical protein HY245_11160, partial [Rhizobiales bacterium]|nr:hypothetical protein [Hyphomicrobiales bacterium]
TEAGKSARLTIRHSESDVGSATPPPEPEPQPTPAPASAMEWPSAEAAPKSRIIIIRHKPGETIDVPLQNDLARGA